MNRSWGNTGSEVVHLNFTSDGSGLGIGYTGGISYFGCDNTQRLTELNTMPVFLEGPNFVNIEQQIKFTASQIGFNTIHGYAFYIDDVQVYFPSVDNELTWNFDSPGDYKVTVKVIDGLHSGEDSLIVHVE